MGREKARFNTSTINSVNVPNINTVVIPADSPPYNSTYKYIRNTSTEVTVWVAVHIAAEVGKGIQLKPGEWWELHADNMTTSAINAISANLAATADVTTFVGKL